MFSGGKWFIHTLSQSLRVKLNHSLKNEQPITISIKFSNSNSSLSRRFSEIGLTVLKVALA